MFGAMTLQWVVVLFIKFKNHKSGNDAGGVS